MFSSLPSLSKGRINQVIDLRAGAQMVGGRGRDRTGDPLLAKQVLSQLSYTPTVRDTLILKHFRTRRNPFLRIMVGWSEPLD